VQVVESETLAEASEQCLAHVRAHTGDELTAAPATQPVPDRLWKQLVETAAGPVSVRRGGTDSAAPIVVLHGAGGSSATVASVADGLAGSRSVIVVDLPGHGESDDEPGPGGFTIDAGAAQVCAVLDALKIETADLVGVEGGAYVALEIAARFPERSGRLALVHPPAYSDEQADGMREFGMPSMAPDWFGGHLLHCWNMVRDSRLYFPWFQRDQAGIIWQEPELDDRRIQLEVTELLKAEGAWQQMLSDELDYPFADKLAGRGDKVTLFASPRSPWFAATERAAAQAGQPFVELDSGPEQWGVPLASALSA
jgi:pimeloyl-ACP methyl ester carboxylesterase